MPCAPVDVLTHGLLRCSAVFMAFEDAAAGPVKPVAGYHRFHPVRNTGAI